jgi:hypothetical protein
MSNVKIVSTESDLFVEFAGIRIAKRGRPGTAQAGTWISLEPGFVVHLNADLSVITVERDGVAMPGPQEANWGREIGQRPFSV